MIKGHVPTMHTETPPLCGFRNHFCSEAIEGALPREQNSPQKVPLGLFAEQISGTAFTSPREENLRTWCYRIKPSVTHDEFFLYGKEKFIKAHSPASPNQLRYSAFPMPDKPCDFIDGLHPVACNKKAIIYLYALNSSMENRYFYNADGELLFIPEKGSVTLKTEFGIMTIAPGQIAVIPRGIIFQVICAQARGYLCENQGRLFNLPALGPIGSNGLANPLDFNSPTAAFEEKEGDLTLICKYKNNLWQASIAHSPLNVVSFKGNYLPYYYDLSRFNTINTVSFDHPDPSIFTVLTSGSASPGVANVDFVIFPERWMVAEDTFRPPYYHRNTMSEFMGLIKGNYDAKKDGFEPGGFSIHNCMSAHGPDKDTYEAAIKQPLKPERYQNTMAFMLESKHCWDITHDVFEHANKDKAYQTCWKGFKSYYKSA